MKYLLLILMTFSFTSLADVPNTFGAGDKVSVEKVNENFNDLNSRIDEEEKDVTCSWTGNTGHSHISNLKGGCFATTTGHDSTPNGTGSHKLDFKTNFWNGNPNCTCSVQASSPGTRFCNKQLSGNGIIVVTSNGSAYNYTYLMVCHGYKQ